MSDKIREEFEAWAKKEYPWLVEVADGFTSGILQIMFATWQASRKGIKVELPSYVNDMDSAVMLYDSITEQLTAAGISYE